MSSVIYKTVLLVFIIPKEQLFWEVMRNSYGMVYKSFDASHLKYLQNVLIFMTQEFSKSLYVHSYFDWNVKLENIIQI